MHHLLNLSEVGLGTEANRVPIKLKLGFHLNVPFPLYFYLPRTFYLVVECYWSCQLVPFSVACCGYFLFPLDLLTCSVEYDIHFNN